jgi:protein-tyrosine phosphatase
MESRLQGDTMEGFIDIHCHMLPQLDDGAKSMEQTSKMLEIAYREGIRTIIATPHYREERFTNPLQKVEETCQKVREIASIDYPDLTIYLGSEIYYSHETVRLLGEKRIPTMADSMYVLVEFSPMAEYQYIKNGLQEILLAGYSPILAHVERYLQVVRDLHRVGELIDMGIYMQVNAMSITGEMGRTYQKTVKKLLKMNYVHLVATDSHSDRTRAPRMQECARYLEKKFGETNARKLLRNNQMKILNKEYM